MSENPILKSRAICSENKDAQKLSSLFSRRLSFDVCRKSMCSGSGQPNVLKMVSAIRTKPMNFRETLNAITAETSMQIGNSVNKKDCICASRKVPNPLCITANNGRIIYARQEHHIQAFTDLR